MKIQNVIGIEDHGGFQMLSWLDGERPVVKVGFGQPGGQQYVQQNFRVDELDSIILFLMRAKDQITEAYSDNDIEDFYEVTTRDNTDGGFGEAGGVENLMQLLTGKKPVHTEVIVLGDDNTKPDDGGYRVN